MTNLEHATAIIDYLVATCGWETPTWKLIDKPKSYQIEFTSNDTDITLRYKFLTSAPVEMMARALHEGDLSPVYNHSKSVEQADRDYIASLPRRQRRAAERAARKSNYANKR